jgi:sigma-B regulation protein RsbU (phosphoserine phosphatase)
MMPQQTSCEDVAVLLRAADVIDWLPGLARGLGVDMRLFAPNGEEVLESVCTTAEAKAFERMPVTVGENVAGWLDVVVGAPVEQVDCLKRQLELHLNARHGIQGFARALAQSWRETHFNSDLVGKIHPLATAYEAAILFAALLGKFVHARTVIISLRQRGVADLLAIAPASGDPSEFTELAASVMSEGFTQMAVGKEAVVVLPLRVGQEVCGYIGLAGAPAIARSDSLAFLDNIGALVVQTLFVRQAWCREQEFEVLTRDLEMAARLQQGLWPRESPKVYGLELVGRCVPAKMIGGDGYDFERTRNGLDLTIADVSGHGVAAGLLMNHFISTLRGLSAVVRTPKQAAVILNRETCGLTGSSGQFVTAVFATFDPATRLLTYTSMGHPLPLLCRAGVVSELPAVGGMPAGFTDFPVYEERTVQLEYGDTVLFYTDGLNETRNGAHEEYGVKRLMHALQTHAHESAIVVLDSIFRSCEEFGEGLAATDDRTAIVMKLAPGEGR